MHNSEKFTNFARFFVGASIKCFYRALESPNANLCKSTCFYYNTMKKLSLIFSLLLIVVLATSATNKRIYINPGHGSWDSNCRPMPTIPYPNLPSTGMPDTLGFYESNTNLWKGLYLRDKLQEVGGFDVVMSRVDNGENKALSEICAEVDANNIDYFVSIHSNGDGTDGTTTNYLLLLYRGTDSEEKVTGSKARAQAAWEPLKESSRADFEPHTHYNVNVNIRGDLSFYSSTSTDGYLGALKHSAPGFLSEGYFHTYQPSRHRALNPDWCCQEGLRYFRGIVDYFGTTKDSKGYIMGAVRTKEMSLDHDLYTYNSKSNDQYAPINGAKVVLRNASGEFVKTDCYRYVNRQLKNQDYYTTDNHYNGIFVFENLEPGDYTISVHAKGYKDYVEKVTVTANATTYPQIFLESGIGTEPNIDGTPTPILPSKFEMQPIYTNESVDNILQGKTIRRALYADDVMYILAVDANKNPSLLAVNPDTHTLIAELPTNHCSVVSADGYELSDIALTSDGVLIGCNMEHVTHTPGNKFKLYQWTRTGNTWTGKVWISHANNETSGNYLNAMVGATIAYSGTSNSGKLVTTARNKGNDTNIRLVIYTISENAVTNVVRNQPANTSVALYGENLRLVTSMHGQNRVILSSPVHNAVEWQLTDKTSSVPVVKSTSTFNIYDANYFQYGSSAVMAVPAKNASNQNVGVAIYDITNGIASARLIETTHTSLDATTPAYAAAFGKMREKHLTLYLLKDNTLSKFSSEGIAQTAVPAICAYNLRVDQSGDNYIFSFYANSDARNAKLVFYDNSTQEQVGEIALSSVVVGENTFTIPAKDLPGIHDQVLTWAVDLTGYAIPNLSLVHSDNSLIASPTSRLFNAVNTNPQSDKFGHIYIMHRADVSVDDSGIIDFDYTYAKQNNTPYHSGLDKFGNPCRISIDREGYLYIADWNDTYSGVYIANTADLTRPFTQFFAGERQRGGAFKNGSVYTGSSTPGCFVYGEGKNTKLFVYNEDTVGTLPKNGMAVYHIGQNDGSILRQWTAAPSAVYTLTNQANGEGNPWATSHGFFVSQVRAATQNTEEATSLKFYDYSGTEQMTSISSEYANIIDGSDAGGFAVSPDEKMLVLNDGSQNFLVFEIEWIGDKPVLSLDYKFHHGITKIRQINWDYAGNLICTGDAGIHVFSLPTSDNHTIVPARKALTVTCQNGIGIKVTGVTLEPHTLRIGVGNTQTLSAIIAPANASLQTVTWKSSNERVATVDANGLVTGVNKGEVDIIVTTDDGAFTDVCRVSVFAYMSDTDAQRIWAYDLRLQSDADNHTFTFKSVGDATEAYLVFFNSDSEEVGRYALDNVHKGAYSITLNETDIPCDNITLNWGVELHADAIGETATLLEITDQSTGKYNFYLPQGLAVDNSPESDYFGRLYVAAAVSGTGAESTRASKQKAGLFIYDPLLNECNPTSNVGIVPSNVTINTNYNIPDLSTTRQQMHRIAVDPITHKVVFAHYQNSTTGAYAMNPANLAADATNLVAGLATITRVNSLCFDQNGTLYVMNNADYVSGAATGQIYKIQDGQLYSFTKAYDWAAADNAIVSDGRGGLWVAQHRNNFDKYWTVLSHINANGQGDFAIHAELNDTLIKTSIETTSEGNMTNASYRGQLAYNERENILAFGAGRRVQLFKVAYDNQGVPTLTNFAMTEPLGTNIDGIAFDYAGDLYATSATSEKLYKFAVPTDNNVCLVPAQSSQLIHKKLNLRDTENNYGILSETLESTTNIRVFRTLKAGMYNTLCLPFDVDNLSTTPLANTDILELDNTIVSSDGQEMILQFNKVNSIQAGIPYLVQPQSDITLPMVFDNVTIQTVEGEQVLDGAGVITFHGILSPVTLYEGDRSILFLTAYNQLAWANTTAEMYGMRAYFEIRDNTVANIRPRAAINTTQNAPAELPNTIDPTIENIKKVMVDGQLYIYKNGALYTITGAKVL